MIIYTRNQIWLSNYIFVENNKLVAKNIFASQSDSQNQANNSQWVEIPFENNSKGNPFVEHYLQIKSKESIDKLSKAKQPNSSKSFLPKWMSKGKIYEEGKLMFR